MKKRGLKGYLPILVMAACAAVLGALTLSGVLDLNRLPELVKKSPDAGRSRGFGAVCAERTLRRDRV